MQADRKGYRLGQIARSYGIRYDEDVAHRADRRPAESAFRVATASRSWRRCSNAWWTATRRGRTGGLRALAEMIRDTSDCAIGYEAARSVLEGLDTFADEYASHVHVRVCQAGVGQTVPCETLCPAHVDVPAYIALTAAGDYAGAVEHGAQG